MLTAIPAKYNFYSLGRQKKCKHTSSKTTSTSSTISTNDMDRIMTRLKSMRHRDSTRKNYYSIWKAFNKFYLRLDRKPDSWELRLNYFVTYLVDTNKQSSTVKSYISAVKAVLREDGYILDQDQFVLNALTRACKLNNDATRTRLPIHKGLLNIILEQTSKRFEKANQHYLSILFQTILITAYFGLFRISEVVKTESGHAVLAQDVQVGDNKNKFMFILRTTKTLVKSAGPQIVKISSDDNKIKSKINARNLACPYGLLRKYSKLRRPYKSEDEKFFVFADGSPVLAHHVRQCLKLSLQEAGFDSSLYSFHSIRAGRAGDLLKLGLSVETIKKIGRWRSNAVFRYLNY